MLELGGLVGGVDRHRQDLGERRLGLQRAGVLAHDGGIGGAADGQLGLGRTQQGLGGGEARLGLGDVGAGDLAHFEARIGLVELAAQDEALQKHDERLARLSALHRGDGEEETVQEKHFRAEGLRDATKAVLRTLGDLAKAYPELKDVLSATLQDHGLHPELLAG